MTGVAPSDEYDNYVEWRASIARFRSECQKVAQHLAAIERDAMGDEQATAARNMKVVEKLCQLDAHPRLALARRERFRVLDAEAERESV